MRRCECGGRMVRVRFDGDYDDAPVRLWICEELVKTDSPCWERTLRAAHRMMRENEKRGAARRARRKN